MGSGIRIGGQPIQVEAGICSNPEPLPAIRELPLGHIDVAWYLLAELEAVTGLDTGILAGFEDRLEEGQIPMLEIALRLKALQADIDRLDAVEFSNHYTSYLESSAYMLTRGGSLVKPFDATAPERCQISTLDLVPPFDVGIEQAAKDAILAYGIHSALANLPMSLAELETALGKKFTGPFPGKSVFDELSSGENPQEELDNVIENIISALFRNDDLTPYRFWLVGL